MGGPAGQDAGATGAFPAVGKTLAMLVLRSRGVCLLVTTMLCVCLIGGVHGDEGEVAQLDDSDDWGVPDPLKMAADHKKAMARNKANRLKRMRKLSDATLKRVDKKKRAVVANKQAVLQLRGHVLSATATADRELTASKKVKLHHRTDCSC